MNHAHDTHWTAHPDPAIPHVLAGWGRFGEGIEHHLDLDEMLVRNVSTDIRSAFSGIEERGNSIFVFEVAGLCIGHLGHLHHVPNDEQFAALGRLDVVMAPVDGGLTLPVADMITVLTRLKSSVVIPMHWFSGYALQGFLQGMSDDFAIRVGDGSSIDLSLRDLPSRPTVIVLQPSLLTDPG
jgi:L-ascorbate metabolism protein UlaG (beta-lactamase superfamily)